MRQEVNVSIIDNQMNSISLKFSLNLCYEHIVRATYFLIFEFAFGHLRAYFNLTENFLLFFLAPRSFFNLFSCVPIYLL